MPIETRMAPAGSRGAESPSDVVVRERSAPAFRIGLLLVLLASAGVAAGLVFHDLSVGHNLYGLDEYDDGVYFAAAMHFVAGQLPYREFVFVQPPGITVVLAPVALLVGHSDPRLGIAIARILTGVTVGLDASLVVWILRRKGLLASLFGGLAFAVFPPSFTADRTLMLEPFLVFLSLAAVALAFKEGKVASNRRLVLAGISLGFAATIKLFAVALAIGFVLALIWRHRRALVILGASAAAAFVVVCLPYFLGAPHAFISEVFGSQFLRTTSVPAPIELRLATLTGLAYATSRSTIPIGPGEPWPWVAGWLLFSVSVLGTILQGLRRRLTVESWCVFATAFSAFFMILVPRQYYDHYAEIAMAFFVLVVGGALGSLVEVAARRRASTNRRVGAFSAKHSLVYRGVALLTALLIVTGATVVLRAEISYQEPKLLRYADPGPGLERAIPKGTCVVSDAASLLVISNRMNLSPSCPAMVDSTGTWLTIDPNHPPQRDRNEIKDPALVALWKNVFAHADYAVFAGDNAFRVPFTPALVRWFNDHFEVVPGAAPITFRRRSRPVTDAPPVPGAVP